jgi:hypothetical protein
MGRHPGIALAVLAVGSALALGQLAAADNATDLDRHARQVDVAASGQGQAQVAGRIADQLNAQWAPHPPAYSPESVGQQRGPEKFGGWGGVLIGDLIALNLAKSMVAAPNNTLTPEEALMVATQQVMDARQGEGRRGWGWIAQDLTGQKLGDLMKSVRPAAAAVTGQSLSAEKSPKGAGKSSGKAAGKTDRGFSNAFDTPAHHATGVVVSGPGVSGRTGRGHDKDIAGKDVADKGGAGGAEGRGAGEGPGGGAGSGGGGGNGGGGGGKGH